MLKLLCKICVFMALCYPMSANANLWQTDLGGLLGSVAEQHAVSLKNKRALSQSDVVHGLKDALKVGSERVVKRLAKKDAFNANPRIHIPLPKTLKRVKSALSAVGMGQVMVDLELRLNRSAEAAMPQAKAVFMRTIRAMRFQDARSILRGPNDAATRYFRKHMSAPLKQAMRPVVEQALQQAGAVRVYERAMGQYQGLPFVPNIKADLSQHVLDLALQGMFHYMAVEEAAIRQNPAKRTTALLKKVFAR